VRQRLVPDEAGRAIVRLGLETRPERARALAVALAAATPSIRTRNHHVAEGLLLIDPRAITSAEVGMIAHRLRELCAES
jgi:hypothetical protein